MSEENVRHRAVHRADSRRAPPLESAVSPLGPLLKAPRDERVNQDVVAVGHVVLHHRNERVEAGVEVTEVEDEVVLEIGARAVRIV